LLIAHVESNYLNEHPYDRGYQLIIFVRGTHSHQNHTNNLLPKAGFLLSGATVACQVKDNVAAPWKRYCHVVS